MRRAVGHGRYDNPEQLDLPKTLCAQLHLYVKLVLLVIKLEEKVHFGSKLKRVNDKPHV